MLTATSSITATMAMVITLRHADLTIQRSRVLSLLQSEHETMW